MGTSINENLYRIAVYLSCNLSLTSMYIQGVPFRDVNRVPLGEIRGVNSPTSQHCDYLDGFLPLPSCNVPPLHVGRILIVLFMAVEVRSSRVSSGQCDGQ